MSLEVRHLFSSMLQMHSRVKSAEFVVLLSLEVGLLAEEPHIQVGLLELCHQKSWRAEERFHHLSYYYIKESEINVD